MSIYEHKPDLTAKQPAGGGGMDLSMLFMCGHKSLRSGGFFRGAMPMRCPACNTKGKQVAKTLDLLSRGWVTALQSAQAGGCLSLSQRVTGLERNEGMSIERKWVETPAGARILAYRIAKGSKPVGVPF